MVLSITDELMVDCQLSVWFGWRIYY